MTDLPFGSGSVVVRHLDTVLDRRDRGDWQRLTNLRTESAADHLIARARAVEGPDQRLTCQAAGALPMLARRSPDSALDLVGALVRHVPLSRLPLQELASRRPEEVARIILGSQDRPALRLDSSVTRLSTDTLLSVVERHAELVRGTDWLRRLPVEVRVQIYETFGRGWREHDGVVYHHVAALLPTELREQEGRRHLSLPRLATRPQYRLQYASLLPWEEALDALEPYLHNSDAELRIAALRALIHRVRYHRDKLPELLALLRARQHERDPVRYAIIGGLAEPPPGRWSAEQLARTAVQGQSLPSL